MCITSESRNLTEINRAFKRSIRGILQATHIDIDPALCLERRAKMGYYCLANKKSFVQVLHLFHLLDLNGSYREFLQKRPS